jgi:hypothetical protein
MTTYINKTRDELIIICKEQKIKGYSSLKKDELIKLLLNKTILTNVQTENVVTECDFF